MKKISSLIIVLLIAGSLFAQEGIKYTNTALEIDGFAEDVWETAKAFPIDKSFKNETPTVTATWQALYDAGNFYILVNVEDDNHWPGWEAAGDNWLYDKPEVYWDVNEVLDDGVGAGVGKGHFQLADGFLDGSYDTPITKAVSGINPGGTYAYSLVNEGYVYEISVPFANFKDNNGVEISSSIMRPLGFDVTVIDQDEGITTSRQRCVWSNDGNGNNGSTDESWNNMDGVGEIVFFSCCEEPVDNTLMRNPPQLRISPNPVSDCFSLKNDIDRVELYNNLGELVYESIVLDNNVSVSELQKGIYMVKAFKKDQFEGVAKIIKN